MFIKINFFYYIFLIIGFFIRIEEYTVFLFILTIMYHIWIYFYNPKFFLLFSWIIIFNFSNLVGMFIIDCNQLYLYEIHKMSKYTGNTVEIILFNSLFLLGNYLVFKYNLKKKIEFEDYFKKNKIIKKIIVNFFIILLLVLILTKINKIAPILGVSRYIYRKYYITAIEDKIMRNLIFIIPLFSSILLTIKRNGKAKIVIILFIIYYITIGHKFGIISYVLYFSLFPIIFYYQNKKIRKIKNKFFYYMTLLTITIILGIKTGYRYTNEEIIQYFNNRISQQAQLYFSTKEIEGSSSFHLNEFVNEIKNFGKLRLSSEERENIGMYKVMKLNMRKDDYELRLKNKSVLAYAFQGLMYYYFNFFITMVIFFLLGLIYSSLICKTAVCALKFKIIDTIFLAKLIQNFHAMIIQGEIYEMITLENIIIYIYFFIIKIMKGRKEKNDKRY